MLRIRRLCAFILLFLFLEGPALAGSFGVICNTDTLNLRSAGSSASLWLGSYSRDTWVEILDSQNNFYYVSLPDGKSGYMSKNYIQVLVPVKSHVCLVNNGSSNGFLNFRELPSYSARVLGIFYDGVPLLVRSQSNGWYCVEINGQVGYVREEYVLDKGYTLCGSEEVATVKAKGSSSVFLRSGPGLGYPVVGQLSADSYVMVLQKGNDWWYVSGTQGEGFLSSDSLQDGLCGARDQGNDTAGYALVNNPLPRQTLNLRQEASISSTVLERLTNGTYLQVLAQGTEWCQVLLPQTGVSGYVMTSYLALYQLPSIPVKETFQAAGSYINLRSSPQVLASNVLCRIPSGSQVTVLSPGESWYKVSYGSMTGYIMTGFLK